MEIVVLVLIIIGSFSFGYWASSTEPTFEDEERRGYVCALEQIVKGKESIKDLLEQAHHDNECGFKRGWIEACEKVIKWRK